MFKFKFTLDQFKTVRPNVQDSTFKINGSMNGMW